MAVRPGYKQTEVGVIPNHWEIKTSEELCVKIQDGTHFSPTVGGFDYLYVTSKNIGRGILDVSNAEQIDTAQHKKIYARCDVKRGDLLLTKDGVNTGNAAINNLDEEFSLLSSVALLRFIPKLHEPTFYLQYILSGIGQARIKELMSGNAITRLTLDKIRRFRFPVPPLHEQQAIAEALSDVDGLIGAVDALIAKKRAIKGGAMQELLTGQHRLPGFAGAWAVKTLGEIAIKIGSGITPTGGEKVYKAEGRPFIRSQNVGWGTLLLDDIAFIDEETHDSFKATEICAHDVLLNITGASIGRSAVADSRVENGNVNQHVCIIRPVESELNPYFLNTFLLSNQGQKQIDSFQSGGNRQGLNFGQIRSFVINLPPVAEQTAIAQILADMDAEIAALGQKRAKTVALKQGMMQTLLTGQVRLG